MRNFLYTTLSLLAPISVLAQPTFGSLIDDVLDIIDILIIIIFAFTLIVIVWGIFKSWILYADNEQEIEKGKQLALAGVIGLFVMSGIWGILAALRSGIFGF